MAWEIILKFVHRASCLEDSDLAWSAKLRERLAHFDLWETFTRPFFKVLNYFIFLVCLSVVISLCCLFIRLNVSLSHFFSVWEYVCVCLSSVADSFCIYSLSALSVSRTACLTDSVCPFSRISVSPFVSRTVILNFCLSSTRRYSNVSSVLYILNLSHTLFS